MMLSWVKRMRYRECPQELSFQGPFRFPKDFAMQQPGNDLVKLYLTASTVDGLPKVFFIGPFGRRVSFASQQRRALNTVWAVDRSEGLGSSPSVAVVGAGIAGLMACAGLIVRGCSVTLFESEMAPAFRQRSTLHRYVHPTVNFWPETIMGSTTSLPFMEWYEASCADVVRTILTDWDRTFADGLADKKLATRVVGINASGNSVIVSYESLVEPGPSQMADFDLVFVASGFGDEKTLSSSDASYWADDALEDRRNAGFRKFAVGGTGDGGLIDSLRLVQRDFDLGRLCLRIVEALDEAGKSANVRQIEDAVHRATQNEDEAAILFDQEYGSLLPKLPIGIRNDLRNRFPDVRVMLVGKLAQPYSLYSAPIHKLMVKQAISDAAIEYVRGELANDGTGTFVRRQDGSRLDLEAGTHVVSRIGPAHPLSGLLTPPQLEQLVLRQRMVGDLLDPVPMNEGYFSGYRGIPVRDPKDVGYAASRKHLVDAFLWNHFGCHAKLSTKKGQAAYETSGPSREGRKLPDSLFGVPLARGQKHFSTLL